MERLCHSERGGCLGDWGNVPRHGRATLRWLPSTCRNICRAMCGARRLTRRGGLGRCWQMFTDPRFPANWGSTCHQPSTVGFCIICYTSIIILGLVSSGSWFECASTVHFSTSPRWLKPVVSSQLLFSWSGAWFSTSINQPSQFLVEHVEHPNITNTFLVYRQTFRHTRPSTVKWGQELSQLGNNMDFYAVAAPRLRRRKCSFSMRAAARVTMETVQELDAPWYNPSSQQLQTWEQKAALKTTLLRLTCQQLSIQYIQYIQQLSRLSYFPT